MILSPHIDRPEVSTRLLELSTALRSFADQNARAYVMVNKEKALVGAFYGECEFREDSSTTIIRHGLGSPVVALVTKVRLSVRWS